MPNRLLRDWTNSDKIDIISFQAEVFFTRLIMKVDDYGCFWADSKRIKSHLFPLKSDSIRDADILRWMAECQKAGLLVVYGSDDKRYLQIVDFGQRLRISKSKFPLPDDSKLRSNDSRPRADDGGLRPEEKRREVEKNRANALVDAGASTADKTRARQEYTELLAAVSGKDNKEIWICLKSFLVEKQPDFIDPFVDSWNLFASIYKLSAVENISDSRRKKFATRRAEFGFDFIKVLEKIKSSPHLKGDNQRGWKVTFDWIIENDKNYLKIIEGQYE